MTIKPSQLANELEIWSENEENVVIGEFFSSRNISLNEREALIKKSKRFKDTFLKVNEKLEIRLVTGALNKRFNHTFVTFLLKYLSKDKEQQTDDGVSALSDEELKSRLIQMSKTILNELGDNENEGIELQ